MGGTERSLWCRLFGHSWHVSVVDLHVPTGMGGVNVYKSERCRRCKHYRKRSNDPDERRSADAEADS